MLVLLYPLPPRRAICICPGNALYWSQTKTEALTRGNVVTRKREILRRCAPQDDNLFVILSGGRSPQRRIPRVRVRIRLERRCGTARSQRAGARPARPHCGQEGDNLRFSPSCQSPSFPLGRAARVKALSRQTATTHLLLQYEGARCHPVGARIARPSRPLRSDRREGCCHPGGVLLNRASARFFAPRCSAQDDKYIVILRSAATKDPARARDRPMPLAPPILPPL